MLNKEPVFRSAERNEDYKDYVILGIGEGGGSMRKYDMAISDRYPLVKEKILKGANYISVEKLQISGYGMEGRESRSDMNKGYLKIIKDWKGPKRAFMEGDGNNLIFPDSSVNEIWVENVFGDPTANLGRKALDEFKRILVIGGTVNIFESYTPDLVIDFFKELMEESQDFEVEIYSGQKLIDYLINEQKMSEREAENTTLLGMSEEPPFIAILIKK